MNVFYFNDHEQGWIFVDDLRHVDIMMMHRACLGQWDELVTALL